MQDQQSYNDSLFTFLDNSPTAFHAASNLIAFFKEQGYIELDPIEKWNLQRGSSYVVKRKGGALIAFTLGSEEFLTDGFRFLGAHTDSPGLQLKPKPLQKKGSLLQLGVEVYGGPLLSTWFDRTLSLAGRCWTKDNAGQIAELLVDFKRSLLIIPSLAIHLNREANKKLEINKQTDLPPLFAQFFDFDSNTIFEDFLVKELQKNHPLAEEILGYDLFCYDLQESLYSGLNNDFLVAPRLDNLLSCHAIMETLAANDRSRNSLAFFANHEEIGSLTTEGAKGSFLDETLDQLYPDRVERRLAMAKSFFVSVDNAHATHPNFTEKSDAEHTVHLNKGVVIKFNANQSYTTTALGAAVWREICKKTGHGYQEFVMRSDLPCGSTIGPSISSTLGVQTVDIGAPTLGMHSIRESTGSKDPHYLFHALLEYTNGDLHKQFL